MRRPTIADVAAASGFSRTAVSHALSGRRSLNAETVRKIRAAADELGYIPSRSARALRLGRTRTLGLLSPAVGDRPPGDDLVGLSFYMRLSAEVARRAFEHDHSVLLLPHTHDTAQLRHAELDGALVSDPETNDPVLAALRDIDVPFVTLEQDPDHPEDPWQVRADHAASTVGILEHFRMQGAVRPALLVADITWAWATQVRDAYEQWCEELSLPPVVGLVGADGAESAARRLLARPDPPDAVFALAEGYAPAVVAVAGSLGIAVPDDLLVACGVDSPHAAAADVPLTAVAQAPEQQGQAAVDLLLSRLDGGPGGPVVVQPELVVRRSSLRVAVRS